MRCNGIRIKYLLELKGYSLTDVAQELGGSPQNVCNVIWGRSISRPVQQKIETLLGMEPGSLEISRERKGSLVRVA